MTSTSWCASTSRGPEAPWSVMRDGPVAAVRFDRPPDHQVRFADLGALRKLLTELGRDAGVVVVVLGCARPGSFIGHADRSEIAALRRGELGPEMLEEWLTTLLAIEDLPQPVIAAVEGVAQGGGCEIALACTFRLAGPDAEFRQLEIDRGVMPGAGATQRLPRLIGPGRAARMIMTGRAVDTTEAHRIGLVDEVLPGPDVFGDAMRWANELARKPRHGLVAIKRAVLAAHRLPMLEGLRLEQRLFQEVLTTTNKEEQQCEG